MPVRNVMSCINTKDLQQNIHFISTKNSLPMASVTLSPKVIVTHAICMGGECSIEANQYSKSERKHSRYEGCICLWVYSRRSVWWNLGVTAPSTHKFVKLSSSSTTRSGIRSRIFWAALDGWGWGSAAINGPVLKMECPSLFYHYSTYTSFKMEKSLDNCTNCFFSSFFVFVPGLNA